MDKHAEDKSTKQAKTPREKGRDDVQQIYSIFQSPWRGRLNQERDNFNKRQVLGEESSPLRRTK